jgi:chaperone BCS1
MDPQAQVSLLNFWYRQINSNFGTGKSSLTFALAGVFGLDIHVVSLLEPTLTEEELGMLFTNLPARCIVLLEDIDTAGLMRNDPESDDAKRKADTDSADSNFNVASLTKALRKANEQSEEERKKGISLSGLLNIIDGTFSHTYHGRQAARSHSLRSRLS